MPIVICPGCGKKLKVQAVGRPVRCPVASCRTVFTPGSPGGGSAPAQQTATDAASGASGLDDVFGAGIPSELMDAAAAATGPALPAAGVTRQRARRRKQQKGSPNLALWLGLGGGGAVAVLTLVIIAVIALSGGRNEPTRTTLPSPSPVAGATSPGERALQQGLPPSQGQPPAAQAKPPAANQPPAQAGPPAGQQPHAPAQKRPLMRFTPANAAVLGHFNLKALPQEAIWYEELQAALSPLLQPVTPLIGEVTELWIVGRDKATLVAYETAKPISVQRVVTQWRAKQAEPVVDVPIYVLPSRAPDGAPNAVAFPSPVQMLAGSKTLVSEALQAASSASNPPWPKVLQQMLKNELATVPAFLWLPSDLMRSELTKALSFVVERQREEIRDAMQRPVNTGMVLRVAQRNATLELLFECKTKGEAETFARWMGGLPDFARRLQEDVRKSEQARRRGQRKNEVEDPARYRRSQFAGAVAALAGIWRDASVHQSGNVVVVRTKVPTSQDWITNRLELLTNPLSAALASDVTLSWPYSGSLDRLRSGIGHYLTDHKQVFPAGTIKVKASRLKGYGELYFRRFSWFVHILPYIGRQNLHDSLDLQKPWSDPVNIRAAMTVIDEFLDPRVPVRRGQSDPYLGLALTHFVGMAGVGYDAPRLPADHPRAGIFGYDRTTKASDIKDGSSHTILLIEVYDVYGPWAVGGGASVRPAQRAPYICVTGAFGSPGDPEGVYVLMADGSVRFLSKSIDSKVFEALCTIAGGERVELTLADETLDNGLKVSTGTLKQTPQGGGGQQ